MNLNNSFKLLSFNDIFTEAFELLSFGMYSESLQKLTEAETILSQFPSGELSSAVLNLKGFNLIGINDYQNARVCFEESLCINSKNIQACIGLGELYLLESNYSEAKRLFEEVLKKNPENLKAKNKLEEVQKMLNSSDYQKRHSDLSDQLSAA